MTKIVFKNLETSELAKEIAMERLNAVLVRFPELAKSDLTLTLSMDNSPLQGGKDVFHVKFFARGGKYRGVILEKKASSLYVAMADLVDHLLERLNRFGDKVRVKKISKDRKFQMQQIPS